MGPSQLNDIEVSKTEPTTKLNKNIATKVQDRVSSGDNRSDSARGVSTRFCRRSGDLNFSAPFNNIISVRVVLISVIFFCRRNYRVRVHEVRVGRVGYFSQ